METSSLPATSSSKSLSMVSSESALQFMQNTSSLQIFKYSRLSNGYAKHLLFDQSDKHETPYLKFIFTKTFQRISQIKRTNFFLIVIDFFRNLLLQLAIKPNFLHEANFFFNGKPATFYCFTMVHKIMLIFEFSRNSAKSWY